MPCKPLTQFGANIYTSNCPCPPNLSHSSEYFAMNGYYVHACGDAPFAPGIIPSGQSRDPFSRPMIMSPAEALPLNVPSRADQKKNIFNKTFSPANRKIFVLLIAAFLIFIAATSYE